MAPRDGKVYDPSVEESPPKNTKPRAYGSGRTHIRAGGGSQSGRIAQPSESLSTIPDCDVETPVRKFVKQGANSSAETVPKGGATDDEDPSAATSKKSDTAKKSGEESDEDEESDSNNSSDSSDSSDSSSSSEEDSSEEDSSEEASGEEGSREEDSSEEDSSEGDSSESESQVAKPKNKASGKGRRSGNSSHRPTKKDELRMLQHLLKKYPGASKSNKGNRTSKTPRPSKAQVGASDAKLSSAGSNVARPTKPSKLKPNIADVKPKGAVAESKTKSKKPKVESGTEGETTDVSRIESASGNTELGNYTRLVLTRMGGWQNLQEINAQPLDNNGQPTYWVDNLGSRQLRPNWDNTIDAEWKVWKHDFMTEFRHGEGFTGDVDYLRRLPEDVVKKKLGTTWKHCRTVWSDKKKGLGGEAKRGRQIRMVERNRAVAKQTLRTQLVNGTVLAKGHSYNFVKYQELQSPEASDAEDKTHKVIDDPNWRSEPYRLLLGALNQKAKGSQKRTSAMKKSNVHYIKVDTPIPLLCDGKRIPRWAINNAYYETHKAEMEEKAYMIDHDATAVPNSLEQFLREFGKETREYLEVRPTPAKPRVQALESRSVSPVTHRYTSSVNITTPGPIEASFVRAEDIDPSLGAENPSPNPEIMSVSQPPPDNGLQLLPNASKHNAMELSRMYRDAQASMVTSGQAQLSADPAFSAHFGGPTSPPPELEPQELSEDDRSDPASAALVNVDLAGKGSGKASRTRKEKSKMGGEDRELEKKEKQKEKKEKKKACGGEDDEQGKKKRKREDEGEHEGKTKKKSKKKGGKGKDITEDETLEEDVPTTSKSRKKGSVKVRVQGK